MRLTVVSNGHGEDAIGARLLSQLRVRDAALELGAFPLVGTGSRYAAAGFRIHGRPRALPAGGLTLHSPQLLGADLRAGLVGHTVRQLRDLRRLDTDVLVTVGDLYAQLLARLVRVRGFRVAIQTLVSRHLSSGRVTAPSRLFMERITLFERVLLRGCRRVYVRDEPTARWLRENAVLRAVFPGNLLLDAPGAPAAGGTGPPRVVLLPGSREWAPRSLAVMLGAAELAPEFRYSLPWAGGRLDLPPGWRLERSVVAGERARVELKAGPLPPLLAGAAAAIGTSGTANEEAAALGLPVLTFELAGLHTASFIANQQRLLGDFLVPVAGTEEAVADGLRRVLADGALLRRLARTATGRFGAPGGLAHVAVELLSLAGRPPPAREPH